MSSPSITLATGDAVVKDLAFRRAAERHDGGGGRATEPPQPMQLSILVETVDGRVVREREREREREKQNERPPAGA